MARSPGSLARPFRAVILALSVHLFFAAMFGISLQFEPKIVQAVLAEPVQAVVIDQAVIERERLRKDDLQRQREAEAKQQVEEKKKKEEEFLTKRADLGWFAAEHFFSLGLLGTIVGLVFATQGSLDSALPTSEIVGGLKEGLNRLFIQQFVALCLACHYRYN